MQKLEKEMDRRKSKDPGLFDWWGDDPFAQLWERFGYVAGAAFVTIYFISFVVFMWEMLS